MMTRVDFHILAHDKKAYYEYLAKLIEKAYLLQKKIFIHTSSEIESKEIDELLWSFRDTHFLPHHIYDEEPFPAPILISSLNNPLNKDVLINLSFTVPNFYSEYPRIIEFVYEAENIKEVGRKKYKQYQSLGCELNTFKS